MHTDQLSKECVVKIMFASQAVSCRGRNIDLRQLKFGLPNAGDKVVVEAETQVDILAEIADLDPDLDGLVERCCQWVERDVIQYSSD